MDDRQLIRFLALGRIGFAAAMLVAPGLTGAVWLGRTGLEPGGRVVVRAMAARDVAIGLGVIAALERSWPVRGWLAAGVLADAADFLATLQGGRDLPLAGRLVALPAAGVGVALGARLVRSLG